ncbi:oocyte zinc finger protein XlCOF29-like [Hyperolius riggenbachi]|uniref:oocyte zinc finger protein XlCOF29-like n=1 Tax=Hyperolius riggenbachi TaxID=752182 RepID=UPI0035A3CD4E
MTTSLRMEDWSHMTERILDLTLEIIQLVTGENYKIVKETSGELLIPSSHRHGPPPITERPPHSLITERNNVKKIVQVINKMMELLTGEEWQYLDVPKEFNKDTLIENQLPLASPDGATNGNRLERYTGPLYPRDCPQEDHTTPHYYQGNKPADLKVYIEEEGETDMKSEHQTMDEEEILTIKEEETYVRSDQHSMEGGVT